MKKVFRNSIGLAFLAVTVGSLSSCGGSKSSKIEFWSSFGAAYTSYLDEIVNKVKADTGYDIHHATKGSYDGIKTAVSSSLATGDYPNLMTGYPDHFASYLGNKVLVQLNPYIDAWNKKHPEVEGGLLADYYEDYMIENQSLDIYKGPDGNVPAISALPFNKSTELMGYNGTFVDYCATIDTSLGTVPATWQQWKVQGPKYRDIFRNLVKITDDEDPKIIKQYGVKLYFDQDAEGKASNFVLRRQTKDGYDIPEPSGKKMLDFTEVDSKGARVISWDSTDNMFITLLRQWGSSYTELPESEKTKDPRRRKGHISFNSAANKPATLACLKYFNEMSTDKVFGVPATFGSSYSSDAFAANKVMFMLCSSGGLSYNTDSWNQRFRVAPIPYYDDGVTQRKFVISQGANIALSNQGGDEAIQKGFDIMVALTRGENQAKWCLNTGYYPCSKSATDNASYQEFLADKTYDDATIVAYREGSNINQDYYMNKDQKWTKFVDPAFSSSSKVRTEIKVIFEEVFQNVKLDPTTYEILPSSPKNYQGILDLVCDAFANDTSVIVDK